ncbi:MAG: hypothetical protein GQ533_10175 [Methanosarcinaceae archaeon]|nr:hypothetical protein [Methanosarcinaceae archaeon]
MKKHLIYTVTGMLLISLFAGLASGQDVVIEMPPTREAFDTEEFTKLEISPRYGHLQLQPGTSKELTVTIKNKEEETITVSPHVVVYPYREYLFDEEWISISPESKEISAGGSQKFKITTTVPEDASIGGYSVSIAFTDETVPTITQQPFPDYIHSFHLSIEVWTPPKVQIQKPYISDQLEAGKEYDYNIKLKNIGEEAIAINPVISQDNQFFGGPFGLMEPAFTDESITITAPKEIPAGGSVEINIHVNVPADAKGNYHSAIDLGIDDSSIREWEGMVQLDFSIWKQPTEPFIKKFSTSEDGPITIEISSNLFGGFPYFASSVTNNERKASFAVTLTGPDNEEVQLKKARTIMKGSVSLGGMSMYGPPWESDSEGIYDEMGIQVIEKYTANAQAGELELGILPQNTQNFEYTITTGE